MKRRLNIYALEAKYEYLKHLRMPAYVVFSLGFPVMFYTLFSVIFGRSPGVNGVPFGAYYLATYGAFGMIQATLYGFGVGVATERGQGWMALKRASPMPVEAYFLAKLVSSVLSAAAILLLLTISGIAFAGLRLSFPMWLRLAVTLVTGAVPFCALGLAIGYWAGPNSAPGVVNLINMPMSIASGLWIPLNFLPALLRRVAVWLPPYHYSQLALATIGAGRGGSIVGHVAALAGFTAVCLVVARAGYRRDEDKTYG